MTTPELDESVRDALTRGGRIDITTTGRKTGEPHRIEIAFHNIDGRLYISGMPGFKRNYIANLSANPHFVFHLKDGVRADLPATARIITDDAERRAVLLHIARTWKRDDLEAMVDSSPLFEVTLDGPTV